MNRNTIWKLAFALLVTANIATLGTVWYFQSKEIPAPPPLAGGAAMGIQSRGGASTFIIKELSLDKEQQNQFEKLRMLHQERIRTTRDELRTAKNTLFNLLSKQDSMGIDQQADVISSRIGALEKKLDMHTFTHFRELRALCNDAQKKKFDSVIQQVLQMMGPGIGNSRPGLRPGGAPPQERMRERRRPDSAGTRLPPPPGEEGDREFMPPPPPEGQRPPPPPDGRRPPPPDGRRPPPPDGEGPPPPREGQRPPPPKMD